MKKPATSPKWLPKWPKWLIPWPSIIPKKDRRPIFPDDEHRRKENKP